MRFSWLSSAQLVPIHAVVKIEAFHHHRGFTIWVPLSQGHVRIARGDATEIRDRSRDMEGVVWGRCGESAHRERERSLYRRGAGGSAEAQVWCRSPRSAR
jgi:hypothetical protein